MLSIQTTMLRFSAFEWIYKVWIRHGKSKRIHLHGRKRAKLQPWNFRAVLHEFNKRRIAAYSRTYSLQPRFVRALM